VPRVIERLQFIAMEPVLSIRERVQKDHGYRHRAQHDQIHAIRTLPFTRSVRVSPLVALLQKLIRFSVWEHKDQSQLAAFSHGFLLVLPNLNAYKGVA
jgi:hypothetical protein